MGGTSERPLAVVALSGGMDSCVTAAIMSRTCRLALLHLTYGQLTAARERRAFDKIAEFYSVPDSLLLVADLDVLGRIGGSCLTDRGIATPLTGKPGLAGIPVSYVPFRNAHILCVAVSWAEVIGADRVAIGAVEQDTSGYPDCRVAFFDAFQKIVEVGTRPETRIRIETPVIGMSKTAIVRKGVELGAPLHLTWSCYVREDAPCGKCDSCVLRGSAFEAAGVADPVMHVSEA